MGDSKMNNRGFTLIELIVTIALLALISTISVSVIGNIRGKHNVNSYYELLKNVESAAKLYVTDNRYNLKSVGIDIKCPNNNTFTISLQKLVDSGYLTTDNNEIKNFDGSTLTLSENKVTVTYDCTKKNFTYKIDKNEPICAKSKKDEEDHIERQNNVCQ